MVQPEGQPVGAQHYCPKPSLASIVGLGLGGAGGNDSIATEKILTVLRCSGPSSML